MLSNERLILARGQGQAILAGASGTIRKGGGTARWENLRQCHDAAS